MKQKESRYKDAGQKMGRPKLYNDEQTLDKMKQLVSLYKLENPIVHKIRSSHLETFSKQKNQENPEEYPFINRHAWAKFGQQMIKEAEQPIASKGSLYEADPTVGIINFSEVISEHVGNKKKLFSILLPQEVILHEALWNEHNTKKKCAELESEVRQLKQKLQEKKQLISRYETYVLAMAHQSYHKSFSEKYGLVDQLSLKRPENVEALKQTENLGLLFPQAMEDEPAAEQKGDSDESNVFNHANYFRGIQKKNKK